MSSPIEHVLVQSVLNASKLILGRPINPKEPLEIEMIQSITSFYNSSELSLSAMRFLFVLLVGHSGMLRADELLSIKYKDIEFFRTEWLLSCRNEKIISTGKVTLVILKDQISLHVQFHLQKNF